MASRLHAKGLWPSEAAAARIIDAAGLDKPDDIDALRRALYAVYAGHLERAAGTVGQQNDRRKHAAKMARHARALLDLLQHPPDRLLDLSLFFEANVPRATTLAALTEMAVTAETEAEAERETDEAADARLKTRFVQALAPVYEAHFKRRAGHHRPRSGGPPDGPFIRFVRAIAKECGFSLSGDTIAKALRGYRSRSRQRLG